MKSRLRSVTLKSFRSFVDETEVDFPEKGLVLFQGASGSGKSTVLMAIAHALGYSPYPATELQSWYSTAPLEVALTLATEKGTAILQKGAKTSLALEQERIAGATAVQDRVRALIGMDATLLSALTYRPQRTPGLFLSKTNAEMQEFLTVLLGLQKYEKAIDQAAADIAAKEGAYERATGVLEIRHKQMEEARADMANLPEKKDLAGLEFVIQAMQGDLDSAGEAVKESVTKIAEASKTRESEVAAVREVSKAKYLEVSTLHDTLIQRLGRLAQVDTGKKDDLQTALQQGEARLATLAKEDQRERKVLENVRNLTIADIYQCQEAENNIKALQADLETLNKSSCPFCDRPWTDAVVEIHIAKTKANIAKWEEILAKRPELEKSRDSMTEALAEPNAKLEEMKAAVQNIRELLAVENVRVESALREYDNKMKQLVAEKERDLMAVTTELNDSLRTIESQWEPTMLALKKADAVIADDYRKASANLEKALHTLKSAKEWNDYVDAEKLRKTDKFDAASGIYDAARIDQKKVADEINALKDWHSCLKEFLTAIFDEVLQEIAFHTNQMLALVPNVEHVTLQFKSESATARGTVKKAIIPVLTIGGAERPLRSALSGGMQTAVELAVDLAVRKVISNRTGASPGWLILDECFEGLGLAEKESCMGLLAQEATDSLVIVVDHMSEFKEMFNVRFTVENEAGRSRIVP